MLKISVHVPCCLFVYVENSQFCFYWLIMCINIDVFIEAAHSSFSMMCGTWYKAWRHVEQSSFVFSFNAASARTKKCIRFLMQAEVTQVNHWFFAVLLMPSLILSELRLLLDFFQSCHVVLHGVQQIYMNVLLLNVHWLNSYLVKFFISSLFQITLMKL